MDRPQYLSKYVFDWELFKVLLGGRSALDSHSFLTPLSSREEVETFMDNYGFSPSDPILRAELFGYFQEALQFIRRYFLSEGNSDGLELEVPKEIYTLQEIEDIFLLASGSLPEHNYESCLWASIVLKIMHIIIHADKDLRSNYFNVIQQQVFDRFYKYIFRDENDNLFIGKKGAGDEIALVDFETKSKKRRDSVIIKLLHKTENVAEELFDRIGVRFVTKTKLDSIRLIKLLNDLHIVMAHNIKPSRSLNRLVDLKEFKGRHVSVIKTCLRNNISEERFLQALEREMTECSAKLKKTDGKNQHSSEEYRSIQFTCRQLIVYKNPMISHLTSLKHFARELPEGNELASKVLALDLSLVARDIRFFYPFEVQVVDQKTQESNSIGEASHEEYKKSQLKTAMYRVFNDLLEYKGLKTKNITSQ